MPEVTNHDILKTYSKTAKYMDKPLLEYIIGVTELRKQLISHASGKVRQLTRRV